jgi:uracil-DNA glycosylase family 4
VVEFGANSRVEPMAFTSGLFTRTELKVRGGGRSKDSGLSDERLIEIGLAGVERMNPAAKHKHIEPTGSKHPDVLILGEAPGKKESDEGRPFIGPTGQRVRENLVEGYRYRFSNVVRTMPITRNGYQAPTRTEILGYTQIGRKDIEETQPRVIIAVGGVAAGWCLGDVVQKAGINNTRGRRFPAQIGNHQCWVYPVVHPSAIMRMEQSDSYERISPEEHRRYFDNDISRVFDDLEDGLPKPEIEPSDLQSTLRGIIFEKQSVNRIQNFLAEMQDEKVVSDDLETNCYRPYSEGSKILTVAIGTYKRTMAFPLDHRQATWSKSDRKRLHEILGNYWMSRVSKVEHNAPFDTEWKIAKWGDGCAWNGITEDTMLMQYTLDERPSSSGKNGGSGVSLNFCCALHFGLNLKEVETIDRANLDNTDLNLVLRYNGRDTKFTDKLYHRLKTCLVEDGQWVAYRQLAKRVPCLAKAQVVGVPVSQEVNAELREKVKKETDELDKQLRATKTIRKFEAKFGKYLDSNKVNTQLFRDMLGRKEGQRGKGYSADDKALSAMTDEPAAALILKIRGLHVLHGTYLERQNAKHEKTFIFPDGRVHTSFKHCATDTRRIQCVRGDTLLETNLGWFNIEDLDLLEPTLPVMIRSHENKPCKITAKWFKGFEPMFRLTFDTGAYIECTAGHQVLTPSGWKQTSDLRVGDFAVADNSFQTRRGFGAVADFPRTPKPQPFNNAGVVVRRVFPNKVFSRRTFGESFWGTCESGLADEVLVEAVVRAGVACRDVEEIFGVEIGVRWLEELETHVSQSRVGKFGFAGFFGFGHREEIGCDFRRCYSHTSRAFGHFQRGCVTSCFDFSFSERPADFGRGFSWVPRENLSRKLFARHAESGVSLLAGLHAIVRNCRAVEKVCEEYRVCILEREGEGPASLLVAERRRIAHNSGFVEKENTIRATMDFWEKEVEGRLYVAEAECHLGSGWAAAWDFIYSKKGCTTGSSFIEERFSHFPGDHGSGCEQSEMGGGSGVVAKLLSIESIGTQAVWDITVEGDHSYASQGLYHHNSGEPSLLNQPRTEGWVKKQYVAEPGCICLFNDYGGQEARCIAVMSKDKNLVRFMRDGFDFHMAWTEKILKLWPKTCKERFGGLDEKAVKKFRQDVKAQWVFASFYNAKVASRAGYLDMPVKIAQELDDEFWHEFAGVKGWQRKLIESYRRLGYVESMGGHRRHGPLNESMVVNAGVQASGTDITTDAWYRICSHAYENDLPWLYPAIPIHDDLTIFSVPKKKREEAVEIFARIMTDVRLADAKLIPWVVEISEGLNWGEKKFVGAFSSDGLEDQLLQFHVADVY